MLLFPAQSTSGEFALIALLSTLTYLPCSLLNAAWEKETHTHVQSACSKMSHMYQSTAEPHKQPLRFRVVLQSRHSGYRERERGGGGQRS